MCEGRSLGTHKRVGVLCVPVLCVPVSILHLVCAGVYPTSFERRLGVCTYVSLCACMDEYVSVRLCVNVCLCACVCACACVCMCAGMCICVCVCVCA